MRGSPAQHGACFFASLSVVCDAAVLLQMSVVLSWSRFAATALSALHCTVHLSYCR